jgi:hypothetical protein
MLLGADVTATSDLFRAPLVVHRREPSPAQRLPEPSVRVQPPEYFLAARR